MGTRECHGPSCMGMGWTPPMDRYFIDLMLEQMRKGSMVNHTYKKQAWSDMIAKFNATFGWRHGKQVLKIRFKYLRKQFNIMTMLLEHGGFVWDEMRQMIVADNDLWDACIKEHPEAQYYKARALPNYNDLFLIYGNPNISEMCHPPSNSSGFDDEYALQSSNVNEDDRSPACCGPLMMEWTKPMNQYFIDLVVDQVQRGNKIGHTFSEQAWICIVTSFNGKFGMNYDKRLLENKYLSLAKEYSDINNLLSHSGFAWDETQQRVIADGDVWEAYIEEHPDAIAYRGRSLGRYKDLCTIYHHGISNGTSSHMDAGSENDNNALDLEMDEIFGLLQSPMKDFEIPYLGKRRQPASFSSRQNSKRVQRTGKDGMQESPNIQASVTFTDTANREGKTHDSIETIVDALQTIPDLDDELFFDACALLEDENIAATFVALDVSKRKTWLLHKLRS